MAYWRYSWPATSRTSHRAASFGVVDIWLVGVERDDEGRDETLLVENDDLGTLQGRRVGVDGLYRVVLNR